MYKYEEQKQKLFTEEGMGMLIKIRDKAKSLFKTAGAARMQEIISGTTGDSWLMLACVDWLVEKGEIKELTKGMEVAGQYRVFISNEF